MGYISTRGLIATLIVTSYLVYNIHAAWNPSYTIYIANGLPDNSHLLRVHCFSGDDDIGYHDLKVNESFHWSFWENIWANTKFYCHFWWNDKERGFGAYTSRIGLSYCGQSFWKDNTCWWLAKADGFYIANMTNPPPDHLQYVNWWLPIGSGGV